MGYKAAVQILKQAEDLKTKVLKKSDLLSDSQAWTDQQKLQNIYHQALVLDLEYALDKKVEQDLWNIGFKNHISVLQELTRDKKNVRRSECQALLTWCLEAASGFYLTLLHELCNVYDIDLPFRRRGNVYGETNSNELNLPQSSSCVYICQYCLVHLGDIARYRNQRKQAENFYKQAILVSPTSGHPYNQLALLEASQGDKLSTVFYYIRGIAVKNPFPASTTNLLSTLSSSLDKESPLEKIHSKITVTEFIQIFLCTHALLHTATDLNQAEVGVKSLNTTMTALVATQSFTREKLIKITAINLYALKHVTSTSLTDELTEDEKIVRQQILDLLAGSLSAFLIPVHTLKNDESLLDYYALPAVKLLTCWIMNESEILNEVVFTNRLQIWPSLCKLLNNVQQYMKNFDYTKYANVPLFEDKLLQGFRPLIKNFKELDFKAGVEDEKTDNLIRMQRLIDFGLFISKLDVNHTKLITTSTESDLINFEPGCIQPDPTNDLLEEMKSFHVTDISTIPNKKGFEKRGGILKPQGSLEKSREERELLSSGEQSLMSDLSNSSASSSSSKKDISKNKRSKQNIALQSIFKKLEENKQVKFKVEEKEKLVTFDTKPSPFNPPLRTQSFNQNHPAFPIPPPPPPSQPDYLNTLRNVTKPPQPNSFVFPPKTENPSMVPFQNNFNQRVYQFPGGNPYKMEETNSPWWPNTSQNYQQRPDSFVNYPFSNNMPYVPDYNKTQNNQAAGDMFNSPWNTFGRTNLLESNMNYENLSMRQTMLKEATPPSRPVSLEKKNSHDNFMQNPTTSPGYSLFNTNTWTPNLVGQLRNNKAQDNQVSHLPQHSLFTGQGPQSLAQLLEQQQSQKSDV
ncbi:nonsense-mediated mRNA decay factor SMG7 isoform X1 [Tribolium castaneum]|uniref:nonsense-mediated mRNA decay factor SMG7 isoform X1 n=1 Tax=Tribolium castaneum TaxID=7070 RepID=UPI0030FE4E9C